MFDAASEPTASSFRQDGVVLGEDGKHRCNRAQIATYDMARYMVKWVKQASAVTAAGYCILCDDDCVFQTALCHVAGPPCTDWSTQGVPTLACTRSTIQNLKVSLALSQILISKHLGGFWGTELLAATHPTSGFPVVSCGKGSRCTRRNMGGHVTLHCDLGHDAQATPRALRNT